MNHLFITMEVICVTSKFISSEGKSYRRCYENLKPAKENDILMVLSDLPNGRALAKCLIVDQKNDGSLLLIRNGSP